MQHCVPYWTEPQWLSWWETLAVYLLAVETLVEDDSHGPNVDLGRDFWRFLSDHKAFWRKVPAIEEIAEIKHLSNNTLAAIYLWVCLISALKPTT